MTDTPTPPVHLDGAALDKWTELAAVLAKRPNVKSTDWLQLGAYCAAFGRWHDAEAWLAAPDRGPVLTIRDDKGNIKSHGPDPHLAIAERSIKEMSRLAKALRI
jgi:phage terminase small subunit